MFMQSEAMKRVMKSGQKFSVSCNGGCQDILHCHDKLLLLLKDLVINRCTTTVEDK